MNYIVMKITYCGNVFVNGENNLIGYQFRVPKDYELELNKYAKLYLYDHWILNPVKNAIIKETYAFRSFHERQLFSELISITSVGPRTALCLLKNDLDLVITAIGTADVGFLANIKGINHKTANLICENLSTRYAKRINENKTWVKDMAAGLENLGYSKKDIDYAITNVKIQEEAPEISDVISQAIKEIRIKDEI